MQRNNALTIHAAKTMQIQFEDLDYQRRAIAAVVGVLDGQVKNTFDNSNLFGIQANITDLTPEQIEANKRRIINQPGRDDAFLGLTFLQALGKCRPVIIMDEPQEGMDTDNAIARLATLKIGFSNVQNGATGIKAKLTVWRASGDGFKWKETNLLTIIPNETYETFAEQYQAQIKEVYGTTASGTPLRKVHKGRSSKHKLKRTALFEDAATMNARESNLANSPQ